MSAKKKIYLSLAVVFILSILIVVFAILPLINNIKENSENLIAQKEKTANFDARIGNIKNFSEFYKDYKPNLDEIESLYIDAEVPISFISFLEDTGKECQLKSDILLESSGSKDDVGPFLAFRINVAGTANNLWKFIEKIKNAQYLVLIQGLTISSSENGSISASIPIKVYTK